MINFFFVNLSIADVVKAIKTLINSIGDFFSMMWEFATHILDYLSWLLESIADTLSVLVQCVTFINSLSGYIPPFATIFLTIFVAGLTIRVVLEVV